VGSALEREPLRVVLVGHEGTEGTARLDLGKIAARGRGGRRGENGREYDEDTTPHQREDSGRPLAGTDAEPPRPLTSVARIRRGRDCSVRLLPLQTSEQTKPGTRGCLAARPRPWPTPTRSAWAWCP